MTMRFIKQPFGNRVLHGLQLLINLVTHLCSLLDEPRHAFVWCHAYCLVAQAWGRGRLTACFAKTSCGSNCNLHNLTVCMSLSAGLLDLIGIHRNGPVPVSVERGIRNDM